MKINSKKIQDFTITFIILTVLSCFLGYLINPSIFEYTPEDPSLFEKQKNFAIGTIAISFLASLMFNRSK